MIPNQLGSAKLQNGCKSCGCNEAVIVKGTPPHNAAVRCLQCNRWIKWLGRKENLLLGHLSLKSDNPTIQIYN